jgi:putative oxidoreductase
LARPAAAFHALPMTTSRLSSRWAALAPRLQSLLRIVTALMFMSAGTTKLFGYPQAFKGGHLTLASQVGIAAILETFGGALVLIGLFTRPVAFLLSGEMAVAYFQVHAPRGFWPVVNGGLSAVLYCFIWLYFSAAGPGPWRVDARRKR